MLNEDKRNRRCSWNKKINLIWIALWEWAIQLNYLLFLCCPKRLINQWRMNWFNGARELPQLMNVGFGLSLIGGLWALAAPMAPPREENQTKNQQWNQWRKKATNNEWSEMKTATSQSTNQHQFHWFDFWWRCLLLAEWNEMEHQVNFIDAASQSKIKLFFLNEEEKLIIAAEREGAPLNWLKGWLWAGGPSAQPNSTSIDFINLRCVCFAFHFL